MMMQYEMRMTSVKTAMAPRTPLMIRRPLIGNWYSSWGMFCTRMDRLPISNSGSSRLVVVKREVLRSVGKCAFTTGLRCTGLLLAGASTSGTVSSPSGTFMTVMEWMETSEGLMPGGKVTSSA